MSLLDRNVSKYKPLLRNINPCITFPPNWAFLSIQPCNSLANRVVPPSIASQSLKLFSFFLLSYTLIFTQHATWTIYQVVVLVLKKIRVFMLLYSELLLTKGFTFFGAKDFNFNKTQKNPARISMQKGGLDSDGREFDTAEEMWREQVGDESKKTDWYREGVGYWEGVEASNDGVLGGFGHVSETDIRDSEAFLNGIISEVLPNAANGQRHLVALDCGSGIGRISKNLLIRYFNEVDLLEPVSHFLETARESLAPENQIVSDMHKATNFFCVPLQEFTPEAGRYDIIWVQWCIGHLTDDDFVSFFTRAKVGLKPGGLFVLKENIARTGGFVLDKEDRSITRSDSYFKELFRQCGLHLYKIKDQKGWPQELFAVKMYALTAELPKKVHRTRSKVQANRPAIIK